MILAQQKKPKPAPHILPRDPMPEAGCKVLDFHFQRMLQNEPGTRLGVDIEALHDMRVATRRMRAAFRIFKVYYQSVAVRQYQSGLKATARALGKVRDWDVLLEKTQFHLDSLSDGEPRNLDFLLIDWSERRAAARQEMLTYLDSPAYWQFKQDFSAFLHVPGDVVMAPPPDIGLVCQAAPALIFSCYEIVLSHQPVLAHPTVKQLHALRIDFKRLRYTLEAFRSLLGEPGECCIDEIKRIQDHLGDLNDADVAAHRLQKFMAKHDAEIPIHVAVDSYLENRQTEITRLMSTFPPVWAHFRQPQFRANLNAALKTLRYPV